MGVINIIWFGVLWYHWVAVWSVILGGFVWMVIPEKSLVFNIVTIGMMVGGVYVLKNFPRPEKEEKKERV